MNVKRSLELSFVLTAAALLTASSLHHSAFADVYDIISFDSNPNCMTPSVALQKGADLTNTTIYADGTSAKIAIDASALETYNYALNVEDLSDSLWNITLECFNYSNIIHADATIVLHNNSTSSVQIAVADGNLEQMNETYNLAQNGAIYIGVVNLVENTLGQTMILQTYLKITKPNTSVYTLYVITFEFT